MEIDIITYSEEQYAALSAEQLQEVRLAQQRKNRLKRKLSEDIKKEKGKLIDNGIYSSKMFDLIQKKLTDTYTEEVGYLRDSLLFYLHYASKPESEVVEGAPYKVDYSLSETERYQIVRQYYEQTYTNPHERLAAFSEDAVAVQYLGELYKTLYDYFLEFTL